MCFITVYILENLFYYNLNLCETELKIKYILFVELYGTYFQVLLGQHFLGIKVYSAVHAKPLWLVNYDIFLHLLKWPNCHKASKLPNDLNWSKCPNRWKCPVHLMSRPFQITKLPKGLNRSKCPNRWKWLWILYVQTIPSHVGGPKNPQNP